MNMNDFLTWSILGTLAGTAAVTGLLTQLLKSAGAIAKMPTQILSYLIALVVLLISTAANGGFLQPWTYGHWYHSMRYLYRWPATVPTRQSHECPANLVPKSNKI